jgi:hypothetical protein
MYCIQIWLGLGDLNNWGAINQTIRLNKKDRHPLLISICSISTYYIPIGNYLHVVYLPKVRRLGTRKSRRVSHLFLNRSINTPGPSIQHHYWIDCEDACPTFYGFHPGILRKSSASPFLAGSSQRISPSSYVEMGYLTTTFLVPEARQKSTNVGR